MAEPNPGSSDGHSIPIYMGHHLGEMQTERGAPPSLFFLCVGVDLCIKSIKTQEPPLPILPPTPSLLPPRQGLPSHSPNRNLWSSPGTQPCTYIIVASEGTERAAPQERSVTDDKLAPSRNKKCRVTPVPLRTPEDPNQKQVPGSAGQQWGPGASKPSLGHS